MAKGGEDSLLAARPGHQPGCYRVALSGSELRREGDAREGRGRGGATMVLAVELLSLRTMHGPDYFSTHHPDPWPLRPHPSSQRCREQLRRLKMEAILSIS